MWQVRGDLWHVTYDMCDMWHAVGGEHSLKILGPKLKRYRSEGVLKIFPQTISQVMHELVTKVFAEQPWLEPL